MKYLLVGLIATVCVLAVASAVVSTLAERRFPPAGKFVEVAGHTLHYIDYPAIDPHSKVDSSIPVVLLHGASSNLLDLNSSLGSALNSTERVVLFDRPGHGHSSVSDRWIDPAEQAKLILAALRELGIERSVWVGHSWAGSVVLAAMLDQPSAVSHGILLAGATHPWPGSPAWHHTLATKPLLGSAFSRLIVPLVGRIILPHSLKTVFQPESIVDEYVSKSGVTLSLRPEAFTNNAKDMAFLSDWLESQHWRYDSIKQPLLAITGTADQVVGSKWHTERLLAQVPKGRWQELPDAGHALHHTRIEPVADMIRSFIHDDSQDGGS